MGARSLLSLAFSLSRFRFWIYTGGTYVVGFSLAISRWQDFLLPEYYLYLLYFFFPANLFIYGVNDLWDTATDARNPKKDSREVRVGEGHRRDLILLLTLVTALSLLLMVVQDWTGRLIFCAFLLLAYCYSAPPVRFKERPFLDFSSNILYLMPGIFGYYLAGGVLPPALYVLGGFCHVAAMHIFSAIPDIEYDREAGITTTPVLLGRQPSLVLCLLFWSGLSVLVITLSGFYPLSFLVLLYPLFPLALLLGRDLDINRLYWYLPYVNTALGGLLFTAMVLARGGW